MTIRGGKTSFDGKAVVGKGVNFAPVWETAAGLITVLDEASSVLIPLRAVDMGDTIIYSLSSGTLPPGVFLTSEGFLEGAAPMVDVDTDWTFTVRAADIEGMASQRTFSLRVRDVPIPPRFVSEAGRLLEVDEGGEISVTVDVTDDNAVLDIALVGGTLPPGASLDAVSGLISGTAPLVSVNTDYTFTLQATDDDGLQTTREFSIRVRNLNSPPLITTPSGLLGMFNEGDAVSIQISANDDNGGLVWSADGLPPGLSILPVGLVTGVLQPVTSDTTYNFEIGVTDSEGLSDRRSFSIIVRDTNRPPVWRLGAGPIGIFDSGEVLNLNLTASDDDDGVSYAITDGQLPLGISLQSNGFLTGTLPLLSVASEFAFQMVATDAGGLTATIAHTFSVRRFNAAPVWLTPSGNLSELGGGQSADIALDVEDETRDLVIFSLVGGSLPPGLYLGPQGIITGTTPAVTGTTPYSFTVRAADPEGAFAERNFNLIVTPVVNLPPVWSFPEDRFSGVRISEGASYSATLSASDPEGGSITYAMIGGSLPTGLTLNASTGVISGTAPYVRGETIWRPAFSATDANGRFSTRTIRYVVRNDAPPPLWLIGSDLGAYNEGSSYAVTLRASFVSGSGTYAVARGSLPIGSSLNSASGVLSGTMQAVGTSNRRFPFAIIATDTVADTSVGRWFSIVGRNVPILPVWQSDPNLGTYNEGATIAMTLVASDTEGVAPVLSTSGGWPSGLQFNNTTGVLAGTLGFLPPRDGAQITRTFVVNALNTESGSDARATQTFTMSVLNTNRAPVWVTPEELGDFYDNGSLVQFTLAATDPEGAPVRIVAASNLPHWVSFDTNTNVLSIRPPPLTDDRRFAYGFDAIDTVDSSNRVRRNFAFTILNFVAPPPVWQTAEYLGQRSEFASFVFTLVAVPTDGTSISYESGNPTWRPFPSYLTLSPSGVVSGVLPAVSTPTDVSFTVRARTSGGGTQSRTFTIRNANDNPAPSWQTPNNLGTFTENSAFAFTFVATDPNGVSYALSPSFLNLPNFLSFDTVTGVATGTLPLVSVNTPYQFRLLANDELDPTATSIRTFTLTVANAEFTPVWTAPPAGSLGTFNERSTVAFTFAATSSGGITYSIESGSVSGLALNASSGVLSGALPAIASNTTQTLVMRAANASMPMHFALRTFSLGILNVDIPPMWSTPGSLGTYNEGATVAIQLMATDTDGAVVSYARVLGSLPSGTTLSATGLITGTLPLVMTDTAFGFTVRATDDDALIADRAFTMVVADVNTPPVWQTPEGSIGSFDEGATISFTLLATDDKAITAYNIVSGSLPTGLVLTPATGRIAGTLALVGADTTFNFVARATDTEAATTDRSFSMTVLNLNAPPVWTTPSGSLGTVLGGSMVNFLVSASDDVGVTSYTVVGGTFPGGLTLDAATGAITGIADQVFTNTNFTFTVRASDGSLFTDRAFSILVQYSGQPLLTVSRSLRRRTAGGTNLNGNMTRTFPSAPTGDTRTLTFSAWVKLNTINQVKTLFTAAGTSPNDIAFNATNQIVLRSGFVSGDVSRTFTMGTNGIEDPNAWMHLVVHYNFTALAEADRLALWVNGVRVTDYTGSSVPNTIRTALLTTSRSHTLMSAGEMTMAEVNVIDGEAVSHTLFGQHHPVTGAWEPITYTGSYGTNGFRLTFANNSTRATLGNDTSGRGNTFTVSGYEVSAASPYYDSLLDVPADHTPGAGPCGNYCIVDSLNQFTTSRAGGLEAVGTDTNFNAFFGSISASTGKYYYEATISSTTLAGMRIGFSTLQTQGGALSGNPTMVVGGAHGAYLGAGVAPVTNGTVGALSGATPISTDIFMLAIDYDAGRIWVGRNGAWLNSGDPVNNLNPYVTFTPNTLMAPHGLVAGTANFWRLNFGASGSFTYLIPSGFVPYVTTNLPAPTITRPSNFVNAVGYTGTGSQQTVQLGFQPDAVWLKNRTSASGHVLFFDSARGASTYSEVGTNTAAITDAQAIISFVPTGFTIGTSTATNNNATTYGAYGLRADPSAGVDVVTWTGNGAASRTVDHDLGVMPHAIIMLSDGALTDRVIYHRSFANAQNNLWALNLTSNPAANSGIWDSSAPTSTSFTVGSTYNANGVRYAAYVMREVGGFSRMGLYSFTGVSTSSLFHLGFRPRVLWWMYFDASTAKAMGGSFSSPRFNRALNTWTLTGATAESSTSHQMSFVSNGVRFNNGLLARGVAVIAFAEASQKYARADR